jgi:hypothetical protein
MRRSITPNFFQDLDQHFIFCLLFIKKNFFTFLPADGVEESRRWQEAELKRKDEAFAAAEEKHRKQVPIKKNTNNTIR